MKNSVGSKQAKTSRKEAGPRAVVQAKNPGQQGGQIVVNAEYLQRIEVLSEENEIENCDFRAWLKNYAPDDIDDIVKALSQKYFALIDCKECANCCRVLELEFTEPELHRIAKSMEQSIDEFKKRFVIEGIVKPCPALKGNLCSIYEGRPDVCRSYPHLEKPGLSRHQYRDPLSDNGCELNRSMQHDLRFLEGGAPTMTPGYSTMSDKRAFSRVY